MDDLLALFGLGRAITLATATIVSVGALFTAPLAAGPPPSPATLAADSAPPALPPEASGEEIYRAACATGLGEALTDAQFERVVKHPWTFCADGAWPRGDLNLPRAAARHGAPCASGTPTRRAGRAAR